jgi:hypothetical protein
MVNIGLTIIVTQSKLFKPLRELFCKINPNFLGILFACTMCFGMWSGMLTSLIFYSPTLVVNPSLSIFIYPILDGFISSIFCYTYYLSMKPLMNKFD